MIRTRIPVNNFVSIGPFQGEGEDRRNRANVPVPDELAQTVLNIRLNGGRSPVISRML